MLGVWVSIPVDTEVDEEDAIDNCSGAETTDCYDLMSCRLGALFNDHVDVLVSLLLRLCSCKCRVCSGLLFAGQWGLLSSVVGSSVSSCVFGIGHSGSDVRVKR